MREVGRLAMRLEGAWFVAYYALPSSMEGALELGRIHHQFVGEAEQRKAFIKLFTDGLGALLEAGFGQVPDIWETKPAPESERGGNA